jgi:predicted permease
MRWIFEIARRLTAIRFRDREYAETDEEMRFHLEMETEKYIRDGIDPIEAERRARMAFGGVERLKEEVRDARGFEALESVASDVGYAVRSFRSGRSSLTISIAVLAVAIGAGTTTFSVVSGVLLDSLPFTDPGRLVNLRVAPLAARPGNGGGATLSDQSVELALSSAGAFESAAYLIGGEQPVLTGVGEPVRVNAVSVAPEFFDVLGSRPRLGRALASADVRERDGGPVVLSHRFWMSRFGGTEEIVGRTFRLDDAVHEVVGVMPAGFEFPEGTQLWQPAPALPPATSGPEQIQGRYWLVGRLADGVSPEQALDRLDARFGAYAQEHPGFASWGPTLVPLRELFTGPIRRPLLLLMGAVALVILIACANVAAVLVARGIARRREIAIRLSMGATRGRVARQLLIEAVLLALLSGAGGTLLALAGVPVLVSLMADQLPGTAQIALNGRVLAVTLAVSTLTGLAAGLLPALLVAREDVSAALRDGSAGAGNSSWRTRIGEGLVVLQVGLGTVLLSAALMLALSFVNLMRVDFGFDPARVTVAQLDLGSPRYASLEQRRQFVDAVYERAAVLPGVQAAAISSGIPFKGGAVGSVEIPGEEPLQSAPNAWFTEVTPDYFRTLGIPLLRGRGFQPGGRGDSSSVVVNESLVRAFFGGEDPIGRTIVYYGDVRGEIVGVVADTRQRSLAEPAPPQLYNPHIYGRYLKVSVRAAGDARGTAAALQQAIRSVDPLLPIDRLSVLTELVDESVARQRFHAVVVSSFALLALFITGLGIYGLTAYSVSRRSREIGIRLAMGATGRHIRTITIGRVTLLAAAGIVLGSLGAWAGARLLEAFVFGLSPSDPRIFAGVAILLMLATVAAAYAPARRATRIDPIVVLRTD